MAPVTIEAKNLTKRYGGRTAVDDVSFTAHEGEVIGLLGPNGAGKTTTVRLLTTVLPASSGTFTVAGATSREPTEVRRRVGALPESAGYPGHLTGAAYLRRQARLFGLTHSRADSVTRELLADVGLQDRGDTRIRTYSRGMRQRLGIARALVHDPVVVFLDEPTLGLDPAGQRQVLDLVRDIAARRRATVVLSTHTLPDVEAVCSSVLILNRGRVVAAGSVHDVVRAAAAPRTVRLRVPADRVEAAASALQSLKGATLHATEDEPGGLSLRLPVDAEADSALRVLLESGVPVLSFELEGARLSDAFLAMTEGPVT
jgi:ABC-2 type transport system ATP-binding protein